MFTSKDVALAGLLSISVFNGWLHLFLLFRFLWSRSLVDAWKRHPLLLEGSVRLHIIETLIFFFTFILFGKFFSLRHKYHFPCRPFGLQWQNRTLLCWYTWGLHMGPRAHCEKRRRALSISMQMNISAVCLVKIYCVTIITTSPTLLPGILHPWQLQEDEIFPSPHPPFSPYRHMAYQPSRVTQYTVSCTVRCRPEEPHIAVRISRENTVLQVSQTASSAWLLLLCCGAFSSWPGNDVPITVPSKSCVYLDIAAPCRLGKPELNFIPTTANRK